MQVYSTIKLPRYDYIYEVKLDAEIYGFISVALKEHLFENQLIFYSLKVQLFLNFMIIDEENVPPMQEYTFIAW